MQAQTDEALMQAIQRGNRDAFALLVSRHLDALYAYAWRLCRDRGAAEDLVQDTWLAVWQKARSYNAAKARVSTWLHRILHNRHIDNVRKHGREQLTDPDDNSLDGVVNPFATDTSANLLVSHELIDKLINALPFEQKSALALTYLQGFSNKEVSAIMGISTRAVESLLARGRAALLRSHEAHDGHPDDKVTP